MDEGIDFDTPLDYVTFQISTTKNRYDAFVCGNKMVEKLASGPLEQLVLHLLEAKDAHSKGMVDNFKLQLPENLRGSSWFSKSTLLRFLHIIGTPELLEAATTIEGEMSQLEDAKRFHLSLYTQGHQDHSRNRETDCSNREDSELTTEIQTPTTSDATKNELLRAMDLRLTVLSQELLSAFGRAADTTCSIKHIADLAAFAEHFGAVDLRNSLFKCLTLIQKNQATDYPLEQSKSSHTSLSSREISGDGKAQICCPVNKDKPVTYGVSPAKVAQMERQSSSESEKSLNSTDEDQPSMERSRPLIRSASPRRSASPMRRIQIGRSGSRRATALAIKSLNFVPARERAPIVTDSNGNSSEEESDQPQKKSESSTQRMSVQDAISLFESKQRNQTSDIQKKKVASEVSIGTNKSVLRRWSAGMGDSLTQCASENASSGPNQVTTNNLEDQAIENSSTGPKPESGSSLDHAETTNIAASFETGENRTSYPSNDLQDNVTYLTEETHDKVTAFAEWNQQRESELHQMMMKMMESKPARNRNIENGNGGIPELPTDVSNGLYDHYKEKQKEKLRYENTGKLADKVAKVKSVQEALDQRKVATASKNARAVVKKDSLSKPRQSQKTSSPTAQPKKEKPNPSISRKPSPNALSLQRKSWPSTPSTKTTKTASARTANELSSAGTTRTRQKPRPAPSLDQPSPKVETSHQQQKNVKGNMTENKQHVKSSEGLKRQIARKTGKTEKVKVLPSGDDNGGVAQERPSFYNKVNKRSTVVPVDSKPYLRKGSGGRGVSPTTIKRKASQSDESLRNSENVIQAQEEVFSESAEQCQQGVVISSSKIDDNFKAEALVSAQPESAKTENSDQFVPVGDFSPPKISELPVEILADEEPGISSIAWVVEDQQVLSVSCNSSPPQNEPPATDAPAVPSSPRVRHSLSQMLQEDSGEPEIIEWGNAENPPAMIYQKDAPKGLKRLLKFARKSRGEPNVAGSSPSVFSEGEEDAEEPKAARRNADNLLRKAAIQAKGFGKQKDTFTGTHDDSGRLSGHEPLPAQPHRSKLVHEYSHKLEEGHISVAATSTKATARSFFSLSTFRSGKSNEMKLQ